MAMLSQAAKSERSHKMTKKEKPEIKTIEETGEIVLSRVVIPAGVRTTCNMLMVPNTSYHRP